MDVYLINSTIKYNLKNKINLFYNVCVVLRCCCCYVGSNVPLIKKSRDNDLDDIIYLKTTPSHPRVRFARNSKIELEKAAKQAAAELRQ